MFEVVFYENEKGVSELYDELIDLTKRSSNNKDARIQLKQITLYIELLKKNGLRLPNNITKHLQGDIWELRPGNNRILYFYYIGNKFVLLHMFRKDSQKTPTRQIEKAINEMNDYIDRFGGKN